MNAADRVYRVLLRAYPIGFREEYEREMLLLFCDQRRTHRASSIGFWSATVWDIARSAPALRLQSRRHRRGAGHTLFGGGTMVAMAILAILIGAVEAWSASHEVWIQSGFNSGYPLFAGILGMSVGVLLMVAGIAMLRRATGARSLARTAAIACLTVFVIIGITYPVMGYAWTILGVGFPLVLLAYLYRSGGTRELGVGF